nr:XRE family transcriptional regulator [uncultured Flavonifractor sp.]
MDGKKARSVKWAERLARSRANDAVKLAFLTEDRLEEIDGLDLTALAGFKRSEKGSVEVQLVDRLAVLRLLMEQAAGEENQQAAEFFQAWEDRAGAGEGR